VWQMRGGVRLPKIKKIKKETSPETGLLCDYQNEIAGALKKFKGFWTQKQLYKKTGYH